MLASQRLAFTATIVDSNPRSQQPAFTATIVRQQTFTTSSDHLYSEQQSRQAQRLLRDSLRAHDIDSTYFELNVSTCFEIDPFREFNDFSEIHFKINDSSVFSPTTSTSHVKGWSRLRDSLRAQDIDFTRQGVEQPTISDFVLTSSTRHAPGSTTRHASTSTQFTSRSNDSSVFFTKDIDFRRRKDTRSTAAAANRQDLASFRRQEVWPPENSANLPSFVSHIKKRAQEHFTSSTTFWRFNFDFNLHQPRVSIFKAFSFSKSWLIHLIWTSKASLSFS